MIKMPMRHKHQVSVARDFSSKVLGSNWVLVPCIHIDILGGTIGVEESDEEASVAEPTN